MPLLDPAYFPYILLSILAILLALVIYVFTRLEQARRRAASERDGEQDYRHLVERLQDGVVILRAGKIIQVNPKVVQWTGYPSQSFVDRPIAELFIEPDRPKINHFFQENTLESNSTDIIEARLLNAIGDHHWIQIQSVPSQWKALPVLVIILKDLTPLYQARQSLIRMEDRSRMWFQISPVGLARYDTNLTIVDANQRMAEILCLQQESLLGANLKELNNPRITEVLRASILGEERQFQGFFDARSTSFAGEILLRAIPYREDNQIIGGIAMVEDLTRWVETRKALASSEDLFSRTFQILPDSATLSRLKDGLYLQVNPGFCQLTGYKPEEVIGKTSLETNLWANPQERQHIMDDLYASGEIHNVEVVLQRKDGSTFDANISARLLGDTPEPALIAYIRDVSDQKKSLALIRKQLEQLAALRKIDQAITGSVNLPFVLRVLLDQVISQLNLDAAAVMVYNPDMDRCDYLAQEGFESRLPKMYNPHLPDGYAARAFYQRDMVVVDNLSVNPDSFWENPSLKSEKLIFYTAVPLKSKGKIYGVLEAFTRRAYHPNEEWFEFLQAVVDQAAIAVENALLFSRLQKQIIDVNVAFDATLDGFARAIDLFLGEPEGYTRAIVYLSQDLAMSLGMDNKGLSHLSRGIYLNSLALICVPNPSRAQLARMSSHDWEVLWSKRKHVLDLLAGIDYLKPALEVPVNSQEYWDGSGHPRGLSGDLIPLPARLYAVTQAWVRIQADLACGDTARDPVRLADEHLHNLAGKQFDPEIVNAFLSLPNREPPFLCPEA